MNHMLNNLLAKGCPLLALLAAIASTVIVFAATPSNEFREASLFASTDVIVVGEVHGTVEIPATFVRFVKAATYYDNKILVVGLEIPPKALQVAKSAALHCDKVAKCGELLVTSPFWVHSRDGRSSKAYFKMLVELSKLEQTGKIRLIGVDLRRKASDRLGDLIAKKLSFLGHTSKAILLTGRGHAAFGRTGNSISSALKVSGLRVASLMIRGFGGTAWVCTGGKCGITSIPKHECDSKISDLTLTDGVESGLCIGTLTASSPIVNQEVLTAPVDGSDNH